MSCERIPNLVQLNFKKNNIILLLIFLVTLISYLLEFARAWALLQWVKRILPEVQDNHFQKYLPSLAQRTCMAQQVGMHYSINVSVLLYQHYESLWASTLHPNYLFPVSAIMFQSQVTTINFLYYFASTYMRTIPGTLFCLHFFSFFYLSYDIIYTQLSDMLRSLLELYLQYSNSLC